MGNSHTTQFGSIPPKGQLPVKEESPEKTTTRWQSLQGQLKEKTQVPPEEETQGKMRREKDQEVLDADLNSEVDQNFEGASTAHRRKDSSQLLSWLFLVALFSHIILKIHIQTVQVENIICQSGA